MQSPYHTLAAEFYVCCQDTIRAGTYIPKQGVTTTWLLTYRLKLSRFQPSKPKRLVRLFINMSVALVAKEIVSIATIIFAKVKKI